MLAQPGASPSADTPAALDAAAAELEAVRARLEKISHDMYEDPPGLWVLIPALVEIVDTVARLVNGIKAGQDALSVVAGLVFHSKELRGVLERLNPNVANLLGAHLGNVGEVFARAADGVWDDLAHQTMTGHDTVAAATELASLKHAAADIATRRPKVAADLHAYAGIMATIAKKSEKILRKGVEGLLDIYTSKLQARRDELPQGVNNVAADMISTALKFGLGAHVAALALEAVPYPKYIGLNQLVGYLADFAGFSKITGPVIDPQLEWGLARPAEHQAAKYYRTNVPSSGAVREQAYQRHVTLDDYRHALRLEGYEDDWIEVLVGDTFVDPRPRELLLMADGAELDPKWVTAKLREVGWDDTDVKRGVDAIMRRARKPATSRYAAEIGNSYLKGYRTLPQVERALGNITKDQAYIDLWRESLREERAHHRAEELGAAVLGQYVNDIVGAITADEMLGSLGFLPEERRHRLALAALKRNQKLLTTDVAGIAKQVADVRGQALTTLRAELRARTLSAAEFTTLGLMLGYHEAWLGAVADLELEKPAPRVVTAPEALGLDSLRAALEAAVVGIEGFDGEPITASKDLKSAALANLRGQLRAGVLPRAEFVALGQMLGLWPLVLEQLADVELLRATVPTDVATSRDPEVLAAAAHAALIDLAADLVQRKQLAGASAIQLLVAAGVPLSPAEVAIGVAEILAGTPPNEMGWPFKLLTPQDLIWTTVLEEVLKVVRGAPGSPGVITNLLEELGVKEADADELQGILAGLVGLFHHRQPRTRDPKTVERPKAPDPLPQPKPEPGGGGSGGGIDAPVSKPPGGEQPKKLLAPEDIQARIDLVTSIGRLHLELIDCAEQARVAGRPVTTKVGVVPSYEDVTPNAELAGYRDKLSSMLDQCRAHNAAAPPPSPTEPDHPKPPTPPTPPAPIAPTPPAPPKPHYLEDQSWRDDAAVQGALATYPSLAFDVPAHFNAVLGRDPTTQEMVDWIPVGARTTWADFDAQLAAARLPPPPAAPPPPAQPTPIIPRTTTSPGNHARA